MSFFLVVWIRHQPAYHQDEHVDRLDRTQTQLKNEFFSNR